MKLALVFFTISLVSFLTINAYVIPEAKAQSSGRIVVVGEDNSRGVVCYATNMNSEHISCVKVR